MPTSSDMVKGRGRQPKSESERGSSVRTPKSPRTPLRPSFETLSPTSSEGTLIFTRLDSIHINRLFFIRSKCVLHPEAWKRKTTEK